jgi:predicted RNA polymerase sigma factor
LRSSLIVGLNPGIAVAQLEGPERGIEEMSGVHDRDRPVAYPFYFVTLGELELRMGRTAIVRERFRSAVDLARSPMQGRFFGRRLEACTLHHKEPRWGKP